MTCWRQATIPLHNFNRYLMQRFMQSSITSIVIVRSGHEGLYLLNCQTNSVIALHAPSLLFWHFINITAYHLGRYEASSPVSCRAPQSGSREWKQMS